MKHIIPLPNLEYLHELFEVDFEKGVLIWKPRLRHHFKSDGSCKSWNVKNSGKVAGYIKKDNGYKNVKILNRNYKVHRILISMFVKKDVSENVIDHINGIKTDNMFHNLRLGTQQQNAKNKRLNKKNKSGCPCVYLLPNNKWAANIRKNKKQIRIGVFDNFEDARLAYQKAARENGFTELHINGKAPAD